MCPRFLIRLIGGRVQEPHVGQIEGKQFLMWSATSVSEPEMSRLIMALGNAGYFENATQAYCDAELIFAS